MPGSSKEGASSDGNSLIRSKNSLPRVPRDARRLFPFSMCRSCSCPTLDLVRIISLSDRISPQYSLHGFMRKRLTSIHCAMADRASMCSRGRADIPNTETRSGSTPGSESLLVSRV